MQNTRIDYVLKMIAKIERKLNCNNISVRINKYKSPITIGVYISKEDKNPLDLLEELLTSNESKKNCEDYGHNILNFTMSDLVKYKTDRMTNIILTAYHNFKIINNEQ